MQVISLFSGIGGFELAAEWMGWENIVSCEINPFGQRVLKHYWPNAYHHDDVHTLTYTRINEELTKRKGADWRTDDIVLVGGFPCQPYSQAGKRLGKDDERHLWPEMLRIISEVKPTYIVGENVYGLVNWSEGLVFEEVCADLEAQGYEVQPVLLPAASIGAPHKRDRVWFVAYAHSSTTRTSRQSRSIERERSKDDLQPCKWGDEAQQHNRLSTISQPTPDTDQSGREERHDSGEPAHKKTDGARVDDRTQRFGNDGPTANTDSDGQHQCDCEHEVNASQGRQYAQRDLEQSDDDGLAPDTGSRRISGHGREGQGKQLQAAEFDQDNRQQFRRVDWKQFPTVAPICSRNDGLSDRLDGITFFKWRNESIKAYRNAIVPQVVYQIFKCLEAMK